MSTIKNPAAAWKRTPKVGASLTDIGAPLRTINPAPTVQCAPLPGSRRKHAPAGPVVIPKGLTVTVCPGLTYDSRTQCAPDAQVYGAGFSACGVGRDVTTGRGW